MIKEVFTANRGRYGYRRVHRELIKTGWVVAKKTVLKLMRQLGLRSPVRRKRYVSYRGEVGLVAPNVLNREFSATEPGQKWVTDITEFRVGVNKLFLSTVMDLFNREILAFELAGAPRLQLTNNTLKAAASRLETGQHPIVHSDQGVQYQHRSWRNLISSFGGTQSMSRKGNCYDNAPMESFFSHLKEECFNHTSFTTISELETTIHDYIRWYNTDRTSDTLGGFSPIEYRTHALAA